MENSVVNYKINYWYDDKDSTKPYSFVLVDSDILTGNVGDIISEIDDIKSDLYFRSKDNLPITLDRDETKNVIDIYYSRAYRKYIYNMAKNSLTDSLVTQDLETFLKLIGVIDGDLYNLSKNIDDAINIDYIDEEHLRHLCTLIGYKWVEALTADEQRESIKFYMYLRRMRGTAFGIKNLIRIFGQTTTSLYLATNNTGVRVTDYKPGNKYKMHPGDIRVEIPELSKILRDAANEVKLMGTRLIFAYRIDIDSTNIDPYGHLLGFYPAPGVTGKIRMYIQPGIKGWDTQQSFALFGTNDITQEDLNNLDEAVHQTSVQDISLIVKSHTVEQNLLMVAGDKMPNIINEYSNKFIYKYRDTYNIHSSVDIKLNPTEPFTELWMFQQQGLVNVRGWLLNEGVIDEDLYLYK